MIKHFEKIENLGVFANYRKSASMAQFERYNLIYGLNGSGKTTLSRFFADLNTGVALGFENLRYKISTDEGEFTQGQAYTRNIRVFNSEYVAANIGEIEGKLNPIFIIGEENKTLANTIEKDEKSLAALIAERDNKVDERENLAKKRGKLFTDTASEISKHSSGTTTRNYRKNNAEAAYSNLETAHILPLEQLASATKSLKQEALPKLSFIDFSSTELKSHNNKSFVFWEALHVIETQMSALASENATSVAIERLVKNSHIALWVEQGVSIHNHSENGVCEYCLQKIPYERISSLASHFNDSDRNLKEKIERCMADLESLRLCIASLITPNEKDLYLEFQKPYAEHIRELNSYRLPLIDHLVELRKFLDEKMTRRTESYRINLMPFENSSYRETLRETNEIISKHNGETDKFDERLKNTRKIVESHFLSTVFDEVKALDCEIVAIDETISICENGDNTNSKIGINKLEDNIRENRSKLSNSHKASEELSKNLETFLGRSDLRLEPEGEGYRIMRFDRAAKRLSEGERTAITFLYFVVGLADQDFNINNGIIVIDDPISSLDSSSVYQAFSFLKNAVKDAHQIFLLTHNFEFLKLLLNWYQNIPKSAGKRTYWMLHCTNKNEKHRETDLKPLDSVLLDNKNEFTYLFKILKSFTSDGTVSNSYPIPNIIRKILETFLDQHSHGGSLHKKLDNLNFDETKKAALYKYANDLSHPTLSGLDPALVGETQNNVNHLLEMMQSVAPVHFAALTTTISDSP